MKVKNREKESATLTRYLERFIETQKGSIVYLSGVPGSGKTYTAMRVLEKVFSHYIYANCAKLSKKTSIYHEVYSEMHCKKKKSGNYLNSLREHLRSCKELHCMLIDEIDLLINKKQDILYNIFDLPYLGSSKTMIIAISNTMNLPEKFFDPKVCSRIGSSRINFKPYTHSQLFSIVPKESRLQRGSIEITTKRVGAISGDARKLFDIIERAKESPKKEITIYDVDETMKKMYKPLYYSFLQNLSFYQKLALFILSPESVSATVDTYQKMKSYCVLKNLEVPDFFTFLDILDVLESYQIIKLRKEKKELQLRLLSQEVQNALSSDSIYRTF